jgi:hypothetical protein
MSHICQTEIRARQCDGGRQVSAGGVLIHEEDKCIAHDHGNRLAMRGRIALHTVCQSDVHAGHKRHVRLRLGAATGAASGLGHKPTPGERISCITLYRKEDRRGEGAHQEECVGQKRGCASPGGNTCPLAAPSHI